jgi:hypothetical protein
MKTKKGSRIRKKTAKKRTSRSAGNRSKPPSISSRLSDLSALEKNPNARICEEVEIGDIGGFGSTEELEAHEERCTQEATTFCTSCSKNLCGNHYEFLHRDHDSSGQRSGQALTR